MGFCHLEPKLSGCNKEVAALHSDHYRQVPLYYLLAGARLAMARSRVRVTSHVHAMVLGA